MIENLPIRLFKGAVMLGIVLATVYVGFFGVSLFLAATSLVELVKGFVIAVVGVSFGIIWFLFIGSAFYD